MSQVFWCKNWDEVVIETVHNVFVICQSLCIYFKCRKVVCSIPTRASIVPKQIAHLIACLLCSIVQISVTRPKVEFLENGILTSKAIDLWSERGSPTCRFLINPSFVVITRSEMFFPRVGSSTSCDIKWSKRISISLQFRSLSLLRENLMILPCGCYSEHVYL